MSDFMDEMNKHLKDVEKLVYSNTNNAAIPNSPVTVPFEVWRMTNDILLSNIEHLYEKIRSLEEDRGFDMDFRIGEIEIHLGGPESSRKDIIEHGEKIIKDITDSMRSMSESMGKLVDSNKVKKNDEANRGFA